jgi:(p)ppGpp synthase/HD superfamily hydrolase
MDTRQQLERAFSIALAAHDGQVDKLGQPYFLHLIRVMLRLPDAPARTVALLHDLLEDTDWDVAALRAEGFDTAIIDAVVTLTRCGDETYPAFIRRAQQNPLAVRVKIADLEDNLSRSEQLAAVDPERAASLAKRYRQAYRTLTEDRE